MNIFTTTLATELCQYYRNLAIGHGVVPKVFSMVNAEGDQYLFFTEDLGLEDDEESNFLNAIIEQHAAVCYGKGTLVVTDDERQYIEIAIIEKKDPMGLWCSAELTLDGEGNPVELTDFTQTPVEKSKLHFSWLFDDHPMDADLRAGYLAAWNEIKTHILHREMLV